MRVWEVEAKRVWKLSIAAPTRRAAHAEVRRAFREGALTDEDGELVIKSERVGD